MNYLVVASDKTYSSTYSINTTTTSSRSFVNVKKNSYVNIGTETDANHKTQFKYQNSSFRLIETKKDNYNTTLTSALTTGYNGIMSSSASYTDSTGVTGKSTYEAGEWKQSYTGYTSSNRAIYTGYKTGTASYRETSNYTATGWITSMGRDSVKTEYYQRESIWSGTYKPNIWEDSGPGYANVTLRTSTHVVTATKKGSGKTSYSRTVEKKFTEYYSQIDLVQSTSMTSYGNRTAPTSWYATNYTGQWEEVDYTSADYNNTASDWQPFDQSFTNSYSYAFYSNQVIENALTTSQTYAQMYNTGTTHYYYSWAEERWTSSSTTNAAITINSSYLTSLRTEQSNYLVTSSATNGSMSNTMALTREDPYATTSSSTYEL